MSNVDTFIDETRKKYIEIRGKYERLSDARPPLVEFSDYKIFLKLFPDVLKAIEFVSREFPEFTKEEKREVAIKFIHEIIDIPYVPSWLEPNILGFAIDVAIHYSNKKFGHKWLDKINIKE